MKTYNQFLETPFSEDKKWIQKATKNMRKDKPCTGEKFGSETCPPGSKRYNLAKTFKKMAKEEVKPVEATPGPDSGVESKERRSNQIKKQVLMKKLQAVRAGSKDIVASHTPEGEVLDEIKSSTLLSYSQKATNDLAFKGDGSKKAQKRATGIKKATGKLALRAVGVDKTNEEVVTERLGGKGYK